MSTSFARQTGGELQVRGLGSVTDRSFEILERRRFLEGDPQRQSVSNGAEIGLDRLDLVAKGEGRGFGFCAGDLRSGYIVGAERQGIKSRLADGLAPARAAAGVDGDEPLASGGRRSSAALMSQTLALRKMFSRGA